MIGLVGLIVCLSACLSAGLLKHLWTYLHENLIKERARAWQHYILGAIQIKDIFECETTYRRGIAHFWRRSALTYFSEKYKV